MTALTGVFGAKAMEKENSNTAKQNGGDKGIDGEMMDFLIRMPQWHEDFRQQEIDALADLHGINLEWVRYDTKVSYHLDILRRSGQFYFGSHSEWSCSTPYSIERFAFPRKLLNVSSLYRDN
jgi:hypothetical protein